MPDKGYGPNFLTLNIVLGVVYGTDTERWRKLGKYQTRFQVYKKDCDTVMGWSWIPRCSSR